MQQCEIVGSVITMRAENHERIINCNRPNEYLNQEFLTPKQLSKVGRKLSSIHLAIGPLVRLFTRNVYNLIENRIPW